MRKRSALVAAPFAALALFALSACGGDGEGKDDGKAAPEGGSSSVSVKVAESEAGSILVDGSGRTLYAFTKDKEGASSCDASCIAVWPALTSAADADAGQGADKELLGRTARTQSVSQVRYGDWPLYYYVGDAVPGDVNGQGLDDEWFAVGADGDLVR